MTALWIVIRIALVLLAGSSLVQCGDGSGHDDDPAEIVVTSSPTPVPDLTLDTPAPPPAASRPCSHGTSNRLSPACHAAASSSSRTSSAWKR